MSKSPEEYGIFEVIASLWQSPDKALAGILPRDPQSLTNFYPRLRQFVESAPRVHRGVIDPAAIVQGEIVSMGEGSVIEAGAVIHKSCRLILGAGSSVRAGAVLRDEVVVGPNSLIGVHCEVVRTVVLGPETYLGHFVYMADSIVGAASNVAGNVMVANSTVKKGQTIRIAYQGRKIDSGRSHLGVLAGDGVRFGASITVCPGCVIMPGLSLPPHVVLYGTIDEYRRDHLMKDFFERWDDPRVSRGR